MFPDDVSPVVERFREQGRTLLMPPPHVPLAPNTVVDISHESLMRIWTRLKTWLDEESDSADMYLKLSEAAQRYQRGESGLWQMPDLQLGINWKEENKPTPVWGRRYHPAYERTMVFLETSRRAYDNEQRNKELQQKRKNRNRNIIALVGATIGLAAILAALLATFNSQEAEKQKNIALKQEQAAKDAAAEADKARKDAERSADEARIAKEAAEDSAAEAKKQEGIAKQRADEAKAARIQADENAEKANVARKAAEDAVVEAKRQEKIATDAKEDASREYIRALSQSMAVKVEDVRDTQLKGLVAMQGYLFYKGNSAKKYNGDIYGGVYDAYKSLYGSDFNIWDRHTAPVRALVRAPEGKTVYTGGSEGKVFAWDIDFSVPVDERRPRLLLDKSLGHMIIRALALSADGKQLVVAGQGSSMYVVDTTSGAIIRTLKAPAAIVYGLILLPDGSQYISLGNNGLIIKGDLNSDAYEVFGTSEAVMHCIDFDVNSQSIVTGDSQGQVTIWDIVTGESLVIDERRRVDAAGQTQAIPVHAVAYSSSGRYLAYGDANGHLLLKDLEDKTTLAELSPHYALITSISFSQDEKLIATTSRDGTAKLWERTNIYDLPIVFKDKEALAWLSGGVFSEDDGLFVVISSSIGGPLNNHVQAYSTRYEVMADNLCDRIDQNMTCLLYTSDAADE